jgi:hypothetical protein
MLNPLYIQETPWHRDWKNEFPAEFREKAFIDKERGEWHRADIYTLCGTAIEFQNSPITEKELLSREAFYPKLIWVLNGKKFKGFKILKSLPDVDHPSLDNFEFSYTANLTMVRKVDVLNNLEKPKILTFHHPELRTIPLTSYYYSFCWRHPHRTWYEAKCPIIIDFGGYFLYQLKHRPQLFGTYSYLHMIPKKDFIAQYCTNEIGLAITNSQRL